MRGLWLEGRALRLRDDIPAPVAPPGEALVRVRVAGDKIEAWIDDEQLVDVEINGQFVPDADGRPEHIVFVVRDIASLLAPLGVSDIVGGGGGARRGGRMDV